jgi:RecG-like helicase
MARQLKVVAVSTNHNSFGLRNMIFIGDNGEGWQAAANDLNVRSKGDVLRIPDDGDIGLHLAGFNFEIPSRLNPDPPAKLMKEVWG